MRFGFADVAAAAADGVSFLPSPRLIISSSMTRSLICSSGMSLGVCFVLFLERALSKYLLSH